MAIAQSWEESDNHLIVRFYTSWHNLRNQFSDSNGNSNLQSVTGGGSWDGMGIFLLRTSDKLRSCQELVLS